MILMNKDQCRSCTEFGRVKGLDSWCCYGIDSNGVAHCEVVPERSNCWCLGMKRNGTPFRMTDWHIAGKYFTERYGKNVKLTPVWESAFKSEVRYATNFRVEIKSDRLMFPLSAVFSTVESKNIYSYEDIVQIFMAYEVQK